MEQCHDTVFRAIKSTCHPRTFRQITESAREFWDSHVHEPFQDLDQYLISRRINIAMVQYFRVNSNLPLS